MNNLTPKSKILEWLLPVLTCIIGLNFTIIGICHFNLSIIPGDLGDARFNMYILEHGYQFITGQVPYFWGAPFFYPFTPAIGLSDNLLGSMPIYALFRVVSFDRETSFQLWFIVLFILNFFSTYYCIKKLTNQTILACAGAYMFAFSLFLFGQFNHAQVFPRFITPLVIYWVIRYFDDFKLKYLFFIVLGVVYQFYCAMYLGFFLSLITIVLFLVLFFLNIKRIFNKDNRNLKGFLKLPMPFIAGVLLILPLGLKYIKAMELITPRNFKDVFNTIPFPSSYFFSVSNSALWAFLSKVGIKDNVPWYDQQLFIGIMPWLALIILIIYCFKKGFITANKSLFAILLSLTVSILLTIRFNEFSLYRYIFLIPGFSAIFMVPRIMNILIILFVFQFAMVINLFVKKQHTLWFSLILIAVIIDNLPSQFEYSTFKKKDAQDRLVPIADQLRNADWTGKTAFAYIPEKGGADFEVQLDAMMASQLVHKKCVNGYSSTAPKNFDPFWRSHNMETLNIWLDFTVIDTENIVLVH